MMNVNRWKDKELKKMEKAIIRYLLNKNFQLNNIKIHSSFLLKEPLEDKVRTLGAFVIQFKNDANLSVNLTNFIVVPDEDNIGYKVGVAVPGFMLP